MAALVFGLIVGICGAGFGGFFALYAMGFFEYLGGKKGDPAAISKDELIHRLTALNDASRPYRIVRGQDTDLIAEWKIVDASWYGIFNKNRLTKAYKALLLVDEPRHSVRCFEEMGSIQWSAGLNGMTPSVHYNKNFFRGRVLFKKQSGMGYAFKDKGPPEAGKVYEYKFDVDEIRGPIEATVKESGWEWVPVVAKRHATYPEASSPGSSGQPGGGYCSQCGAQVGRGDNFCHRCGHQIG